VTRIPDSGPFTGTKNTFWIICNVWIPKYSKWSGKVSEFIEKFVTNMDKFETRLSLVWFPYVPKTGEIA
jgi:hypothetical protein